MPGCRPFLPALACAAFLHATASLAHGPSGHAAGPSRAPGAAAEQHAFGRAGDARRATRTVRIDMADTMRFAPDTLTIRRGETVRFLVTNRGKTLHEMVLGTREELERHAELMKKFPNMEHDEPYMAHVKPGARETIVWTFNRTGTFMFGCLLPGHFEAGMKGAIRVVDK